MMHAHGTTLEPGARVARQCVGRIEGVQQNQVLLRLNVQTLARGEGVVRLPHETSLEARHLGRVRGGRDQQHAVGLGHAALRPQTDFL